MKYFFPLNKLIAIACFLLLANVAHAYTSITVFGDSALDGGNDATAVTSYYKVNGDPFEVPPPIPHVPQFDFRFTDGYTFIEVLGQSLNLFDPSTFYNYAFGGQIAADLDIVLNNYLNDPSVTVDPDGLYVIALGMNDLISLAEHPQTVSDDIIAGINTLYDSGARHFLIINSMIGGDLPSFANDSPVEFNVARNQSLLFNAALQTKINALPFSDDVILFGLGDALNQIVNAPSLYGFSNGQDPCITSFSEGLFCSQLDEYLFWDDVHLTGRAHALIGKLISSLVNHENNAFGVKLTLPAENANFIQGAPIKLAAATTNTADNEIQSVSFYSGQQLLGTATTPPPYTLDWVNDSTLGTQSVTAVLTGTNGDTVSSETVTFTTIPQTTTVDLYLANNASGNAKGSIVINVNDSFGAIDKVELYYGGNNLLQSFAAAPYIFYWDDAPDGDYSLTAKVYGTANSTAESQPLLVSVNNSLNNQPPNVTIGSPISNNGNLSGSLLATANDPDGTIDRVVFMVDGAEVVTDNSGPYWLLWDGVPEGEYVINAAAYDNEGAVTVSEPIAVTVQTLGQ